MEYIYGDVLFVINFCMDFLSLYISGKLMHMKMSRLRLIIAATIGGIYGVVAVAYLSGFAEKAGQFHSAPAATVSGFLTARHCRVYDGALS